MSLSVWEGIVRLFVPLAIAASQSLMLIGAPAAIDERQEADIGIEFLCPSCADSYLRAVFYESGTSYFGYTQSNDGTWSNAPGSLCMQYYFLPKDALSTEGTWSGRIRVKPDLESTNYKGPGEYSFKVGRYTPGCSSASVWSEPVQIAITGPTNTPTQMPSSTPEPSCTPSYSPTHTIRPVVHTPLPVNSISTPTLPVILYDKSDTDDIQGVASETPVPVIQESSTESGFLKNRPVFPILIAGIGVSILSFILSLQKTYQWKQSLYKTK